MKHHYANDGRILTPPKELKSLLKNSFQAFSSFLDHIRFFYVLDELWDGETNLIFTRNNENVVTIIISDGFFSVSMKDKTFNVTDEILLDSIFEALKITANSFSRPVEQLTININGFPCGYRCDLCTLNEKNNESKLFNYMNWVCYCDCLEGITIDKITSNGNKCKGCELVRKQNPKYCRYINCATEKWFSNCVACKEFNTCNEMKDSHHPGQCSLGLTSDEITKLVVPYYMKWRLNLWDESIKIKEFYNDISEDFAKEWYENNSLYPVLKEFISLLPPSPKVLDLGCGAGYESMRLRELGADVVGIDISDESIKIAKAKNPDCYFEVMDMRAISSSLGLFDGVVAIASLIHINEGELSLVFSNIKNVLKTLGYFLVIVVAGNGLSEERSHIEINGKQYNRYFYLHNKDTLCTSALEKGFSYIQTIELPKEHSEYGWQGYLFQSTDREYS